MVLTVSNTSTRKKRMRSHNKDDMKYFCWLRNNDGVESWNSKVSDSCEVVQSIDTAFIPIFKAKYDQGERVICACYANDDWGNCNGYRYKGMGRRSVSVAMMGMGRWNFKAC
ncbi:hypothetical protein AVEN_41864-1 [Araneus ventricosus]|uniref:Uncharacterized protein n=1 Tax=Araneus ventricosus TaxID=182803 RepID=A0A4Y2ADU8_ARAVE|nr:hypothetical protein AVEN_41864-1 [Araneus ventricosus]